MSISTAPEEEEEEVESWLETSVLIRLTHSSICLLYGSPASM